MSAASFFLHLSCSTRLASRACQEHTGELHVPTQNDAIFTCKPGSCMDSSSLTTASRGQAMGLELWPRRGAADGLWRHLETATVPRMKVIEDRSPRRAGSGAHSPPLREPVNEVSRGWEPRQEEHFDHFVLKLCTCHQHQPKSTESSLRLILYACSSILQ